MVLTYLAVRGCEAVQGTSSCGTPGFFLLTAIMILLVVLVVTGIVTSCTAVAALVAVSVLRWGAGRLRVLDEAANADLLVVGARGHGGFAGLLLGSVSSHVANNAPCSVLVIRHDDAS